MAELATLVAAIATLLAAATNTWIAYRTRNIATSTRAEVREVHLTMNSRMDELLNSTKAAAHAAGVEEGRDER